MDNFGFIETIKAAAEFKGWNFYLDINDYYTNAVMTNEHEAGQLSLVLKSNATPKWAGLNTHEITYTNKIMLGRKMDDDLRQSSLDETYQQKYDRRLKDLETQFDEFLKVFKCDNDLELGTHSGYQHAINQFDKNIDVVIVNNITFIQ